MQENGDPQQHGTYMWKNVVKKCKAKRIDIVAHSFGGVVTVDLVSTSRVIFKNHTQDSPVFACYRPTIFLVISRTEL